MERTTHVRLLRTGPRMKVPHYCTLIRILNDAHVIGQANLICDKHVKTDVLISPVSFLKDMANHIRKAGNTINGYCENINWVSAAKDVPFYITVSDESKIVESLKDCAKYPDLVQRFYRNLFCAGDAYAEAAALIAAEETCSFIYNNENFLVDTDLMCIFACLVALSSQHFPEEEKGKGQQQYLRLWIYKALNALPATFASEWSEWPFSTVQGGPRTRDLRTFCAMVGTDNIRHSRRKRRVVGITEYRIKEITSHYPSVGTDDFLRVYTAKPVHDAFRFIPEEYLKILFGEKLMKVMDTVRHYSSINAPFLLASDTSPVKNDRSIMVPLGCGVSSGPPNSTLTDNKFCPHLSPTDKLTLVSRHVIPTARRLGLHMLRKDSSVSMERSIAECMVEEHDEPSIVCPETEIEIVAAHIAGILDTTAAAAAATTNSDDDDTNCVLCFKTLNLRPQTPLQGNVSFFDFFAFHSFMDTFECSSTTCSARACPECTIRLILSIYEKVTSSGGVQLKDAFRCPHCGEYMVNFMGRGYEFSSLCKRTLIDFEKHDQFSLPRLLLGRAEGCFAALELLQEDFLNKCNSGEDVIKNAHPKFYIRNNALRPLVKKIKLSQASNGNSRCSLSCTKCLTPVACDEPANEEDFETIAVPPPVAANPDEEYDDGPGTHRWPARLSCGLVTSAASSASDNGGSIETCTGAIAFLGRAPRKKFRGWNAETPEGKAIIALANWQKSGRLPQGLEELLSAISAVYLKASCFCQRRPHYTFMVGRNTAELLESCSASKIPLISCFFAERNAIDNIADGGPHTTFLPLADLFVKNMLSEILLDTPECVLHRARSFVLRCIDIQFFLGKTPDDAAKNPYIQQVNAARMTMNDGTVRRPTYTAEMQRTVEWAVEKGGDAIKQIQCSSCGSLLVKVGGCVIMTCSNCGNHFCWICEASDIADDHALIQHMLLYSSSFAVKKTLQMMYGGNFCSLKRLHVKDSYLVSGKEESIEVYVMEDGYEFDANEEVAYLVIDDTQ